MIEVEKSHNKKNIIKKINELLRYTPENNGTLKRFDNLINEIIYLVLSQKDYKKASQFIERDYIEWSKINSEKGINNLLLELSKYYKISVKTIVIIKNILSSILKYKKENNLDKNLSLSFLKDDDISKIKKFLKNLPNFGDKKVQATLSYYFVTDDIVIDDEIISIIKRIGIIPNDYIRKSKIINYLKKEFPDIFNYDIFYKLKIHYKKVCTELNPFCNLCQLYEICDYKKQSEKLWVDEDLSDDDLTIIELFSGAGGMSQGFSDAGFKTLIAIDFNNTMCKTFKENHHKTLVLNEDLTEVSGKRLEELLNDKKPKIIIGGPPCQGFSIAGKQDPKDPRNTLFMEFVRILNYFKAPYFVMENVPGLLSSKTARGEPVINIIINEFKKIGYRVKSPKILHAADYGVPQIRRRVIIIGTNTKNRLIFPPPITHSNNPKGKIISLKKWVPVKKILFDKNEVDPIYFHTEKMIEGFKRRKKRNIKLGKGYGWQILDLNKPSYTISARYWKDGSEALVKYNEKEIRMLTERECAIIQTFPDNYIFLGTKSERYTQIGNAVPCLLAQNIAISIKNSLLGL